MSECYIDGPENGACSCCNCDWSGTVEQAEMVRDIQERIFAGETVPAGQCPECGALCFLETKPDPVVAELRDALIILQTQIRAHVKFNVKKHYSLMVADAAATAIIKKTKPR